MLNDLAVQGTASKLLMSSAETVYFHLLKGSTVKLEGDVVRFRLNELMERCNRGLPPEQHLHMQVLADAIQVPRGTLSGLTSWDRDREPVTTTATLEALFRFFRQRLGEHFHMEELFERTPDLDPAEVSVLRLYPKRTDLSPKLRERAGNRRRRGGE